MISNNTWNIDYYNQYGYNNNIFYLNNNFNKIFIIWLIFLLIENLEYIITSYILIFFLLFLYQPY